LDFAVNLSRVEQSRRTGLEKLEIVKERGEPACGQAADYGGFSSPPQAAKNVRANLRIVHQPR